MAQSDFVGDFLAVLRNASRARKDKVTVPTSAVTTKIAEILQEEGFIQNVKVFNEGPKHFARIHFKYLAQQRPAIQGIRRISKPGLRAYRASCEIPNVQGGLGIAIVSTSKGLLSDRKARSEKIGGELVCTVW